MSLTEKQQPRCSRKTNGGFTLVEVLVSLTILALGLLGITAMQTSSLRFNNAALLDSQAQFLLNDMVERIRANNSVNTYLITYTEELDPLAVDCAVNTCNSNQMAQWDMNQWRSNVVAALPQGESQILFNPLNRVYVVSIRYDWSQLGDEDGGDGKRTLSITTRIQQ